MQAAGSALPHLKDPRCLIPWRLCPKAWCNVPWWGCSAAGGCDMWNDGKHGGRDVVTDERRKLGRMEERQPHPCPGTGPCSTQGAAHTFAQGRASCCEMQPQKGHLFFLSMQYEKSWPDVSTLFNYYLSVTLVPKQQGLEKASFSSAWKKAQATAPLQEEELFAKQQSARCSGN